jgi:hypothetical protein
MYKKMVLYIFLQFQHHRFHILLISCYFNNLTDKIVINAPLAFSENRSLRFDILEKYTKTEI